MQMDESEEQSLNPQAPMDKSVEPDSNVTIERDLHAWKQRSPSVSTDEGMQIDGSEEHPANVARSIEEM
jgi:hypothetical protein